MGVILVIKIEASRNISITPGHHKKVTLTQKSHSSLDATFQLIYVKLFQRGLRFYFPGLVCVVRWLSDCMSHEQEINKTVKDGQGFDRICWRFAEHCMCAAEVLSHHLLTGRSKGGITSEKCLFFSVLAHLVMAGFCLTVDKIPQDLTCILPHKKG